jgi:hypothetical protein
MYPLILYPYAASGGVSDLYRRMKGDSSSRRGERIPQKGDFFVTVFRALWSCQKIPVVPC